MTRLLLALSMVFIVAYSNSQTLTELQTFRGNDTPNGSGFSDNFGREIDISGNIAVIGAPNHNENRGAVYVFELNGSNQWIELAKLTASDAAIGNLFGSSVAIVGDVIVAGNGSIEFADQGAYIFERPGSGWVNATETIKLNTPASTNSSNTSAFGFRVDINGSGSEILVGAPYEDNGAIQSGGRIYVYEKSGASWSTAFVRAELTTTNVGNGDLIGYSAVFGDNFIVTGALTGSSAGTLHVFEIPASGTWANATTEDIILFGSDRTTSSNLGAEVATSGDRIITNGATDGTVSRDMNLYFFDRESALWSSQTTQNEQVLSNMPSYFLFQGYSSFQPFSADIQSNLFLIGNGLSSGPNTANNGPSGSVFILNHETTDIEEIDGLNYSPDGLFGSAVAIDGSKVLISSPQETLGGVVRYFDYSYVQTTSRQLCDGGSITFGTQTITSPGTYTASFNSQDLLDSLVTLTVTASDLAISTTKTDNICFGESNGEIQVGASGGITPYEYSLDGVTFVQSSSFSFLATGTYTVTVRDANGCEISETVDIEEPNQITLDQIAITDALCSGEASGIIEVSANGGTGSIEFKLAPGNFDYEPSPISASQGSYVIFARDENGCEIQLTSLISVGGPEETLTPTIDTDLNTVYGSAVTGIVIEPDPLSSGIDEAEVTHFLISEFDFGQVFKSDGITPIAEGEFITVAEAQAGLVFQPEGAFQHFIAVFSAASDRQGCVGGSQVVSLIDVDKAPLTATMPDQTIIYGETPDLSVQYSGFVNSDGEADLSATITVTTDVMATSSIGTYPIRVSGSLDDNYEITYFDGIITIEKASLSATANDQTIMFGDAMPSLDGTIAGLRNNDSISASYSTTASSTSDVGTYPITITLNDPDSRLGNYSTTLTDGTFTINKAEQTITFLTIVDIDLANANMVTLSATTDSGLPITYTLDEGDGSISGTTITVNSTGNFTITASQSGNSNFNEATSVSQSFAVTDSRKQDQTITFNAITDQTYGDQVTLGATASSNLAVTYTLDEGVGTITNGVLTIEGTGTYEVEASQEGDNTFNPAPSVTQTFNATKATLTVTADDQMINEGDVIPTLTITYSGFKLSDDAASLDETPSISTTATAQSAAGTYPITLSGGEDDLYNITLVDGSLTIERLLGNSKQMGISVYPNPATTQLRIEGSAYHEIRLISLDGKEIKKAVQAEALDLSELDQGQYIIQLFKDREVVHQQKIIKR
ncbi:MAG: MBG domain-containing protein [Bacteroidota bacterium]